MTDREHAAFIACYAAAWFQSTARFEPGVITDTERAVIACAHADRMVKALREVRPDL